MLEVATAPFVYDISEANLRLSANFASINKLDTVDAYRKQINKGREHYATERIKITHVVSLSKRAYDRFTGNLLEDVDWLIGLGGHDADMPDQPTGTFLEWTAEQQAEFRRTSYRLVVAVTCNERPTIFVDPQGYSYARYVGLS